MAALDRMEKMYGLAFKAQLLRLLVRDHLPHEKHPFKGPSELPYVVSMVKMHTLLSESDTTNSSDPTARDSWKAAVDAWVNRVSTLASSNMILKSTETWTKKMIKDESSFVSKPATP